MKNKFYQTCLLHKADFKEPSSRFRLIHFDILGGYKYIYGLWIGRGCQLSCMIFPVSLVPLRPTSLWHSLTSLSLRGSRELLSTPHFDKHPAILHKTLFSHHFFCPSTTSISSLCLLDNAVRTVGH